MRTLDVPQANDLDTVRAVVRAVSRGADSMESIAEFTGYSFRHAQYRLHAARVLGLIQMDGDVVSMTVLGDRLIASALGSDIERQVYWDAIQRSPALSIIAPDLLSPNAPSLDTLTMRLFEIASLSRSTAERRASGLLTWRRRVLGHEDQGRPKRKKEPQPANDHEQLSLFG